MRSAKLIVNPIAGRGRAGALLPDIQSTLKSLGIDADVAHTHAPGEAAALAQRAKEDGFELVIAAGGDGTQNEIVNGLMRAANAHATGTLAIIPVGSGNDFVKMLDVPLDWRAACEKIANGKTRRIDVGCVNGRYFLNNVGIGFDAQVGIEARKVTWARGFTIYVVALARNMLLSYRTPHATIELDDQSFEQTITLLTVGNGRCSGGGFWLTPNALIDDGLFDVCIARGLTKPQILALIPDVMKGTHINKEPVRMAQARKVVVTSDEPLPVHADGEILYTDARQLVVEILPQKLDVIG
jgi:diacylglycerol kinase (ATP)